MATIRLLSECRRDNNTISGIIILYPSAGGSAVNSSMTILMRRWKHSEELEII